MDRDQMIARYKEIRSTTSTENDAVTQAIKELGISTDEAVSLSWAAAGQKNVNKGTRSERARYHSGGYGYNRGY